MQTDDKFRTTIVIHPSKSNIDRNISKITCSPINSPNELGTAINNEVNSHVATSKYTASLLCVRKCVVAPCYKFPAIKTCRTRKLHVTVESNTFTTSTNCTIYGSELRAVIH